MCLGLLSNCLIWVNRRHAFCKETWKTNSVVGWFPSSQTHVAPELCTIAIEFLMRQLPWHCVFEEIKRGLKGLNSERLFVEDVTLWTWQTHGEHLLSPARSGRELTKATIGVFGLDQTNGAAASPVLGESSQMMIMILAVKGLRFALLALFDCLGVPVLWADAPPEGHLSTFFVRPQRGETHEGSMWMKI